MDTLNLSATPRKTGTKAAKAIRREDRVPCVLYGPHQAPVHFAVERLALRPLIHTSQTYRVVVQLDGEAYDAILKDVSYHPVTDAPIHVDFQALTKGEKITLTIPVHIEGVAPGVKAGGVLSQPLHEIEVRCVPAAIPGQVSIDVSSMEVGDALHVSDLAFGEGVEVLTEADRTVVTVTAPRVAEELEEVEPIEGEALLLGEDEEAPEEAADGSAPEEA